MINYTTLLRGEIQTIAKKVPVTLTYPDTDIVPIVIVRESDQIQLFKCSQYEHASSTMVIEVYTEDIATRNSLRDEIDKLMKGFHFELAKKEDLDNNTIYVSKLTYQCEVIEHYDNGSIQIYNKKNY